jgi:hypothetical protein
VVPRGTVSGVSFHDVGRHPSSGLPGVRGVDLSSSVPMQESEAEAPVSVQVPSLFARRHGNRFLSVDVPLGTVPDAKRGDQVALFVRSFRLLALVSGGHRREAARVRGGPGSFLDPST